MCWARMTNWSKLNCNIFQAKTKKYRKKHYFCDTFVFKNDLK